MISEFYIEDFKRLLISIVVLCLAAASFAGEDSLSLDNWNYIEVDYSRGKWGNWEEPNLLRYFCLAMEDVNGDGY